MSFQSLFTSWMLLSSILVATPAAGLCTKIPQADSDPSPDQAHPLLQQASVPSRNLGLFLHPKSYSAGPAAAPTPYPAAPAAKARVSGAEAEAAAPAPAAAPASAAADPPARAASQVQTAQHAKLQQQQQQSRLQLQTNSCTFRAYGVQLCDPASASPVTYLQINQILNADGSLAFDVRRQRPRSAFNSYEKLIPGQPWAVASLDDSKTLGIRLDGGGDGMIEFTYGSVKWTVEDGKGMGGEGWCEAEGWNDEEEWDCGKGTTGTRSNNMVCGFPCGVREVMELK